MSDETDEPEPMRRCARCEELQPVRSFSSSRGKPHGMCFACKIATGRTPANHNLPPGPLPVTDEVREVRRDRSAANARLAGQHNARAQRRGRKHGKGRR